MTRSNVSRRERNNLAPVGLDKFDEGLARLDAMVAESRRAIRRSSPKRRGLKVMAVVFGIVLVAGIASAAFLYFSNKISGTANPSGGLSVAGAFAASYPIGTSVSNDWTVTNQAGVGISFSMQFNATAAGIACTDIVVAMPGGTPTCALSGTTATYTSAPIATIAPGGNQVATVQIKFVKSGSYALTMQALGN